jgi:glycosyltransferase involved in cell wall biosynthesis
VLSTEHSIGETHLERRKMTRPVQALYLGTELFSDMSIAVSAAVRDRMTSWGIKARKLTVIPNGVDLDRVAYDAGGREKVRAELGIGSGDYVVLMLGRLDQNKQFDLAIEAAAPSLGPSAKVLVVGGGAERDHLEETARRCGVRDYVVFAGERHDVAAVLSAADLLVASSRQETFGLCVLEALANGIRVLYTTCPALDGVDVELARQVPIEHMSEAIAKAVAEGHRDRKPEQAVEDEFGIAAVTRRVDDLYERLASRNSWRTMTRRITNRARQRARARSAAAARPAVTVAGEPAPPRRSGSPGALASAAPARSAPASSGPAGALPARAVRMTATSTSEGGDQA